MQNARAGSGVQVVVHGVTVRVVEAVTFPEVAWIVVVPLATIVAMPVLLMVATAVLEELHDTPELMSRVVPSLKKPVAENCTVP